MYNCFHQANHVKFWLDGDIENGIISAGYLIMSYKNIKGYVCADNWLSSVSNMRVACGILGFPAPKKLRIMQGSWPFILNGLKCDGAESSLLSCNHTGFGYAQQECKSSTAVWLQCKTVNRTAKFKNVSRLNMNVFRDPHERFSMLFTKPITNGVNPSQKGGEGTLFQGTN